MKLKILFIISLVLIITGCGEKTLKCEKKTKNPGYDYYESYTFLYDKKEELSKVKIDMKATFNEFYTDEEIDKQYKEISDECHMYEVTSIGKIECNMVRNGKKIEAHEIINVKDMEDDLFELIMYLKKDDISDATNSKKILQNIGYTCK